MYKALLWKEYREMCLSLALTALGCTVLFLAIVIKGILRYSYYESLGRPAPDGLAGLFNLIIILLLIIYPIITGSESFASEYQTRTYDFLISRAVSLDVLWYCKLASRISTLLFPIVSFILINRYLHTEEAAPKYQYIFSASVLLLFSTCFFFSTILNSPVKAGITGLIVYFGFTMLFFHFSKNYITFAISSIFLSILILGASFVIFTKSRFSYVV